MSAYWNGYYDGIDDATSPIGPLKPRSTHMSPLAWIATLALSHGAAFLLGTTLASDHAAKDFQQRCHRCNQLILKSKAIHPLTSLKPRGHTP